MFQIKMSKEGTLYPIDVEQNLPLDDSSVMDLCLEKGNKLGIISRHCTFVLKTLSIPRISNFPKTSLFLGGLIESALVRTIKLMCETPYVCTDFFNFG